MDSNDNKIVLEEKSVGRRSFLEGSGKLMLGTLLMGVGVMRSSGEETAPGFFELRVYTAVPGKRDALAKRFIESTAAVYARHGITNVGYWIPQQNDPELGISAADTFIYIRGYPSKEDRDKRLREAHSDPEFQRVVIQQETNPATKLIIKAHNIDMLPSGPYTAISVTK
jgi:hypothetical protein